eukprot:CAMPEP_0204298800 /NCGR_PEP_ID=MMETSP0468-20130131/75631_1 /ASSEMBLY_ACC=CAM_ASM_000383 /TAXON_ID=2969 /ORGANISM="Oxyrrhis marina" /LENGTH=47 /DNA_ID= /DNA_START= /DNA_END= /DNA_ORIENTATION=
MRRRKCSKSVKNEIFEQMVHTAALGDLEEDGSSIPHVQAPERMAHQR